MIITLYCACPIQNFARCNENQCFLTKKETMVEGFDEKDKNSKYLYKLFFLAFILHSFRKKGIEDGKMQKQF